MRNVARVVVRKVLFLFVSIIVAMTQSGRVIAQSHSSFTSGSAVDANSANYNARVSAGENAVGIGESASFRTFTGFINPDEEYIELNIPLTTIDMGILTPGTPGTGTATFTARSYLNDEYVIVTPRDAPTLEGGTETINPMTTAAAFNASQEQFGMNLVANTSPVTQGSNPAPQPNGSFAFGVAYTGYNTTNLYKYEQGDVIAESVSRGYGETQFTISYIMNITTVTPAGRYTIEQDLVMFATF
jgi:hypothetical protein